MHDPFEESNDGKHVPYHLQSYDSYDENAFQKHLRMRAKQEELVRTAPDHRKKGTEKSWHTPDPEVKK